MNWGRLSIFADCNIAEIGLGPMIDELPLFRCNLIATNNFNFVCHFEPGLLMESKHVNEIMTLFGRYGRYVAASRVFWPEMNRAVAIFPSLTS